MTRPTLTTRGFLIHARPQGEHSSICTFLTLDVGKVQCRMPGNIPESAREFEIKLKSSKSGHRAADFRYLEPVLLESGEAMYFTLYLNELIYRLLPFGMPEPPFYGCYMSSLLQLSAGNSIQPIIRFFEMKLLTLLGLTVDFSRDVQNLSIAPERSYRFIVGQGFDLDRRGRFNGAQIIAAGHLDSQVVGALSVARECLAEQLAFACQGQAIVSRQWPLGQLKKATGGHDK